MDKMHEKIHNDKNITDYDVNEIKYLTTPIGEAIYKTKKLGRPRKEIKANWNDKVKCEVCGGTFTRSARTQHKSTKIHKVYLNINKKLQDAIINK